MLIHELPLIVESHPRVVWLQLHEGGEDKVVSGAVGFLEVFPHYLWLILVLDWIEMLLAPSFYCVSRLSCILAWWWARTFRGFFRFYQVEEVLSLTVDLLLNLDSLKMILAMVLATFLQEKMARIDTCHFQTKNISTCVSRFSERKGQALVGGEWVVTP